MSNCNSKTATLFDNENSSYCTLESQAKTESMNLDLDLDLAAEQMSRNGNEILQKYIQNTKSSNGDTNIKGIFAIQIPKIPISWAVDRVVPNLKKIPQPHVILPKQVSQLIQFQSYLVYLKHVEFGRVTRTQISLEPDSLESLLKLFQYCLRLMHKLKENSKNETHTKYIILNKRLIQFLIIKLSKTLRIFLCKSEYKNSKLRECQNFKVLSLNNTIKGSLQQVISLSRLIYQPSNKFSYQQSIFPLDFFESNKVPQCLNFNVIVVKMITLHFFKLLNKTKKFRKILDYTTPTDCDCKWRISPHRIDLTNHERSSFPLGYAFRQDFAAILRKNDIIFRCVENHLNIQGNLLKPEIIQNDTKEDPKYQSNCFSLPDTVIDSRLRKICNYRESKSISVKVPNRGLHISEDYYLELQSTNQNSSKHACSRYNSQIQFYKKLHSLAMQEKLELKRVISKLSVENRELQTYKSELENILNKFRIILFEKLKLSIIKKDLEKDTQILQSKMFNQKIKFLDKIRILSEELYRLQEIRLKLDETKMELKYKEKLLNQELQTNNAEKSRIRSLEDKNVELEKIIKKMLNKAKVNETKFSNESVAMKSKYLDLMNRYNHLTSNQKFKEIENEGIKNLNYNQRNYELLKFQKGANLNTMRLEQSLKVSEEKRSSLEKKNKKLLLIIKDLQSQVNKCNKDESVSLNRKKRIIETQDFA